MLWASQRATAMHTMLTLMSYDAAGSGKGPELRTRVGCTDSLCVDPQSVSTTFVVTNWNAAALPAGAGLRSAVVLVPANAFPVSV
jgi:hypothetical protein